MFTHHNELNHLVLFHSYIVLNLAAVMKDNYYNYLIMLYCMFIMHINLFIDLLLCSYQNLILNNNIHMDIDYMLYYSFLNMFTHHNELNHLVLFHSYIVLNLAAVMKDSYYNYLITLYYIFMMHIYLFIDRIPSQESFIIHIHIHMGMYYMMYYSLASTLMLHTYMYLLLHNHIDLNLAVVMKDNYYNYLIMLYCMFMHYTMNMNFHSYNIHNNMPNHK